MIRYILAADWWPVVRQQDYQFVTGEMRIINEECHPNCNFRQAPCEGRCGDAVLLGLIQVHLALNLVGVGSGAAFSALLERYFRGLDFWSTQTGSLQ